MTSSTPATAQRTRSTAAPARTPWWWTTPRTAWGTARTWSSRRGSRRCPSSGFGRGDHPAAGRVVRGLVDQDEAAGHAVALVGVGEHRLTQAQAHPAHVVERQLGGLLLVEAGHVDAALDGLDLGRHGAGGVLELQAGTP